MGNALQEVDRRHLFFMTTAYCVQALMIMIAAGCSLTGGPRARLGYLPTATFGVPFPDPNRLGRHSYGFGLSETSGLLYTCRGGHIDLDHVRGAADNTRWLVNRVRQTLSKNGKGFSFSLTGETSSHRVQLTYPQNWDVQSDKERIIEEIAFDTGPYLAYNAMLWHEILTWFGVSFVLFEPHFNSSFSWEDVYSNLLGVHLALEAIRDTERGYDEAMTMALERAVKDLEVQPASAARAASEKVRGDWYTGNLVPDMKMRNFDIGLNGYVTPTLIHGVGNCGTDPLPLAVPTLDTLHKYGFSMYYEIKPRVWEQGRIFEAAGSNKIIPEEHFPIILEYMKRQAKEKGYEYDA